MTTSSTLQDQTLPKMNCIAPPSGMVGIVLNVWKQEKQLNISVRWVRCNQWNGKFLNVCVVILLRVAMKMVPGIGSTCQETWWRKQIMFIALSLVVINHFKKLNCVFPFTLLLLQVYLVQVLFSSLTNSTEQQGFVFISTSSFPLHSIHFQIFSSNC